MCFVARCGLCFASKRNPRLLAFACVIYLNRFECVFSERRSLSAVSCVAHVVVVLCTCCVLSPDCIGVHVMTILSVVRSPLLSGGVFVCELCIAC